MARKQEIVWQCYRRRTRNSLASTNKGYGETSCLSLAEVSYHRFSQIAQIVISTLGY